jgi:hypothetical protein
MAVIDWVTARAYVTVAITGFGPSGHDPTQLPVIDHSALDGPTTQDVLDNFGNYKWQRWNYGIPAHELKHGDVQHLMDWFKDQYPGATALQLQAKGYGGFVVNLTWLIMDANHGFRRLFNFHIKVNAASMDMKALFKSGATGLQKEQALNDMFPPLGK